MARKVLYQTVKDKGNPDFIKSNGPIYCNTDDAWLGHGYYFWDTFEELGHWWGEHRLREAYMVWQALCDFDSSKCFDLHGEPEHLALFRSIAKLVIEQDFEPEEETTVAEVLYYMRNVVGIINHYDAIRATGVLSISPKNKNYNFHMRFELDKNQYLDMLPPIQICIFDLKSMNFRDHLVVFPEKYTLVS